MNNLDSFSRHKHQFFEVATLEKLGFSIKSHSIIRHERHYYTCAGKCFIAAFEFFSNPFTTRTNSLILTRGGSGLASNLGLFSSQSHVLLTDRAIFPSKSVILFFAAYVICKKKYSFSRVVFLFFQTKIANFFYSKKMEAVGLGQQGSQAVGSGSLSCQIFLRFIPNIFLIPAISEILYGSYTKFSAL